MHNVQGSDFKTSLEMATVIENSYESIEQYSVKTKDQKALSIRTPGQDKATQVRRNRKLAAWCASTTAAVFFTVITFILASALAFSAVVILAIYIPEYNIRHAASSQDLDDFESLLNTTTNNIQANIDSLNSQLNTTTTNLQIQIDSLNQEFRSHLNTTASNLKNQSDGFYTSFQSQLNTTHANFRSQIKSSNLTFQLELNTTATDVQTKIQTSNQALISCLANMAITLQNQIDRTNQAQIIQLNAVAAEFKFQILSSSQNLQSQLNIKATDLLTQIVSSNQKVKLVESQMNDTANDLYAQVNTFNQDSRSQLSMSATNLQKQIDNSSHLLQLLQCQLNTTASDFHTQIDNSYQAFQLQLNTMVKNVQANIDSSRQTIQSQWLPIDQELQMSTSNQDIQTLQTQLDGTSKTIQSLQSSLQALQSGIYSANHKIQDLQANQNNIETLIQNLQGQVATLIKRCLGSDFCRPVSSCQRVLECNPSCQSGYYWIRSSNGNNNVVQFYCDMTRTCGGITGGWMRIAALDMRVTYARCPSGLTERVYPGHRLCGMNIDGGCSHVNLWTNTVRYDRVCGKIIGYQYASPDSFASLAIDNPSIDNTYVDGISLTYGEPRQHIWSFAAGLDEVSSDKSNCPCTNTNYYSVGTPPPSFVGNDYFCDTGSAGPWSLTFYPNDPLWDGAGCAATNHCCTLNNPPWFYKQLPHTTYESIEMRVCCDQDRTDEDIWIEQIEIYVR